MNLKRFFLIAAFVAVLTVASPWAWRPDACGQDGAVPCPAPELANGLGRTLPSSEACAGAGYLCADLERGSELQVRRRHLERGRLLVRIPRPERVSAQRGKELRLAVAAAVLAWDGHPFPIAVDMSPIPLRRWDVEVLWTERLRGGEAGVTWHRWREEEDGPVFEAPSIAVVYEGPSGDPEHAPLTLVAATASHEMGHALGLRHSESRGDIMYPTTRGSHRPSRRDLATVSRLYELPNGAVIVR